MTIANDTEYAKAILELQDLLIKTETLKDDLRTYNLLNVRESTKLGRVHVKFSKGSTLRDYPGTWRASHPGLEPDKKFLKVPAPSYDYKSALEAEGYKEFLIKSHAVPSVEFELIPEKA